MTNLFQIGAVSSSCKDILPIVRIIKTGVLPIIQIGIPIILILLGTIDLGKAVIASDEKEVKAAQSRLIKRCIYAVAIFFIVTLVTLVMNLIGKAQDNNASNYNDWKSCWSSAG